jgi:rare lipoprotein A
MTGTPRTHVMLVALACLAPATMAAPALAQDPGGVGFPTGGSAQLAEPSNAMLGDMITFSGTLPASAGATIEVQREDKTGTWVQTATAIADVNGFFQAQWHSNRTGEFPVRALPASEATTSALATAASPTTANPVQVLDAPLMTIYRPSIATWYGPGFIGRQMACGHTLTKHTLGVANRTLPCGTQVQIDFRGRTITVPVVDRGPYANHAEWDLTQATARALSIDSTETIGTLTVPGTGAAPSAASAPAKQPASASPAR